MIRKSALVMVVLLLSALLAFAQEAERRTALIIGNSAYKTSPLKNPASDARDITEALKGLGFQVTTLIDATKEKMFGAIRDFGKELARGGVGLFFYAGHGMQVRGANYLIPIGADIQSEDEVPFQAVDASLVLSKMESAGNRVNIVILDACRDNPFAMSFRSTGRGLSVVEAPRGSLVVYATAPGSVAAEGQGQNGVFTAALLRNIRTPGIDAELTLRKVRQEVMYDTVNAQVPWTSSSLTGSFYFAGKGADTEPATAGEQAAPATQPAASAPERKPILLVEKAYGSVTIEVRTAGELYLNGEAMGSLTPGSSARLDDLEAGKANLEMRYRDGNRESRTVEVPTNGVAAVSFSYVERPKAFENMVLVEGGTFHMGDTFGNGDSDEKPVHPVTVSSFFLGKCEVTQREWREVMGSNPLKFKGDDLPVENVCWYDAAEYCNKLSKRKGLEPCYTISGDNVSCDFSRNGFRLPTEAEWEFAARGGVRSSGYKYSGGNNLDAVAWYDRNSGGTHPVGGKQANEIGLYDMSGNVWEWCWDWYGPYPSGSQTDPMGASSGQYRVLRGGSWDDFVRGARASNRYWDAPGFRDSGSGFRVAARAP